MATDRDSDDSTSASPDAPGADRDRLGGEAVAESLRERKKRLTRQLISDTATAMFLEQGFDTVRVADVADAAGVSEKTVYNYFPTKESLLLDREPEMIALVHRALGPDARQGSPVEAFVAELTTDVENMIRDWNDLPESTTPAAVLRSFRELIETTPSLRAAERDMMDRVTGVAAEELAARAGVDPSEPEPQVAAAAICALWGVMHRAMERHVDASHTDSETTEAIVAEIERAARLIDTGLWSFSLEVQGTPTKRQRQQAADAAVEARKQVIEAVRAAKIAWRELAEQSRSMHGHPFGGHPFDRPGGPGRGPGAGRWPGRGHRGGSPSGNRPT